jgi:hypothetical protein
MQWRCRVGANGIDNRSKGSAEGPRRDTIEIHASVIRYPDSPHRIRRIVRRQIRRRQVVRQKIRRQLDYSPTDYIDTLYANILLLLFASNCCNVSFPPNMLYLFKQVKQKLTFSLRA